MEETDVRVEQIAVGLGSDRANHPREKRRPDHRVVGLDHGRDRDFMDPILPSPHVFDGHTLQGTGHGWVLGAKVQSDVGIGIQIPADDLSIGIENGDDVGFAAVLLELLIELFAHLVGCGLSCGRVGLVEHRQHVRRARALGRQIGQLEATQLTDVAVNPLSPGHPRLHLLCGRFFERGAQRNIEKGSEPS